MSASATPEHPPSALGEAAKPAASPERVLRLVIGLLAIAGVAIATYIAIVEADGGAPVCLAGGGGCTTVAESEYAELAGINVAAIGVFGYLSLLASAFVRGDVGRASGLAFGLIGFGFSVYLTYLELFVIDAICEWCVASAVLMTVLMILTTTRFLKFAGRT